MHTNVEKEDICSQIMSKHGRPRPRANWEKSWKIWRMLSLVVKACSWYKRKGQELYSFRGNLLNVWISEIASRVPSGGGVHLGVLIMGMGGGDDGEDGDATEDLYSDDAIGRRGSWKW